MVFGRIGVVVLLFFCATIAPANADWLEVRRVAIVRAAPSQDAQELDRAEPGTRFALVDDGSRSNNYLEVEFEGQNAWVHASRVRRHRGDMLGVPTPISLATTDRVFVHYIDVDQGSATLVEFPCAAILVDAGGQTQTSVDGLMSYLADFFARRADLNNRLETIFITHTHIDHNRGLRRVVENYDVGSYVHNGILRGSGSSGANWVLGNNNPRRATMRLRAIADSEVVAQGRRGLSDGDIDAVNCPRINPRIRVLSGAQHENPGWSHDDFENGNNQSLVIRIDYGEASFLFTGDMEEPALETMVDYYRDAQILDADAYLVGHHGSYNGVTYSLLEALTPEIAIISMGEHTDESQWTAWQYGHPRRPVIDLLEDHVSGARETAAQVFVADAAKRFSTRTISDAIYATGWDGDIVLSSAADGVISVSTHHR